MVVISGHVMGRASARHFLLSNLLLWRHQEENSTFTLAENAVAGNKGEKKSVCG